MVSGREGGAGPSCLCSAALLISVLVLLLQPQCCCGGRSAAHCFVSLLLNLFGHCLSCSLIIQHKKTNENNMRNCGLKQSWMS